MVTVCSIWIRGGLWSGNLEEMDRTKNMTIREKQMKTDIPKRLQRRKQLGPEPKSEPRKRSIIFEFVMLTHSKCS